MKVDQLSAILKAVGEGDVFISKQKLVVLDSTGHSIIELRLPDFVDKPTALAEPTTPVGDEELVHECGVMCGCIGDSGYKHMLPWSQASSDARKYANPTRFYKELYPYLTEGSVWLDQWGRPSVQVGKLHDDMVDFTIGTRAETFTATCDAFVQTYRSQIGT